MDTLPVRFGYRAVQEQYTPQDLLGFTVEAERQGFEFVCISDHFHPWFHKGGHAGFAWVWIASAAERTTRVRIGTGVTTPIHRYHPAIVGQAFATLDSMYPGRVFLGLGTGEAMNETPMGRPWPGFDERFKRIEESIRIIRLLWEKEFVTYSGEYFSVTDARLYTRPSGRIPIYIAASGARVAELAGKYADGFFTTPADEGVYRSILFPALEKGAKSVGRDPEGIRRMLQFNVSYDEDYDRALNSINRWRAVAIPGVWGKAVWDPRKLEELGQQVQLEQLAKRWVICTSLEDAIRRIEQYIALGFNEIQVRSCSPDELGFIKKFGSEALPYLTDKYGSRRTD